ncbi:MAG: LysR family transcriptional regulator, partial [Sneathiella sp.]
MQKCRMNWNWNDLKYFLAVRRHGTLSAAAHILAVNQTTVSRRLQRLEQQTHQKLLHRSGTSFSLTPDGIRFANYAEKVEDAVQHLENSLGPTLSVQGPLKITAVESLINQIFLPALPAFQEEHPHIELNLFGSSSNLEIGRLEADIGVRLARPTSGPMITVKLGTLGFAVYGT